jgi:hypothetical protein
MDRARRRRDKHRRNGVLSRSTSEQLALRDFLRRIEPAMLLRWAMMSLEVGANLESYAALCDLTARGPARLNRVTLARGLHKWTRAGETGLSAKAVVEHFHRQPDSLRGNARYELACYFAQIDEPELSLNELEQSLELGENRLAWAENDPQLAKVRECERYQRLRDRYAA